MLSFISFSNKAQVTDSAAFKPKAEVINFSTIIKGDLVKLEWITKSESNLKEFVVKRSVDNKNYYVVANLPAKNTQSVKSYTAIDKTASGGINFYRLYSVDIYGTFTELKNSKIDMVDKEKAITLTYDYVHSTINLISGEQINSMQVELTDILQRDYFVNFVRDSTHGLTLITNGALSPGVYYLKCLINKNRTVIKPLIVVY